MSINQTMVTGIISAFLMDGVEIIKIDSGTHTLYISLPKQSKAYGSGSIQCAEDYAKRIKETWIKMGIFPEYCTVKYKIRDVNWTKEMGEKNLKDNLYNVLQQIGK